ncbi:MAG: hypothetical protein ACSW8H_06965 [bacterium]
MDEDMGQTSINDVLKAFLIDTYDMLLKIKETNKEENPMIDSYLKKVTSQLHNIGGNLDDYKK